MSVKIEHNSFQNQAAGLRLQQVFCTMRNQDFSIQRIIQFIR